MIVTRFTEFEMNCCWPVLKSEPFLTPFRLSQNEYVKAPLLVTLLLAPTLRPSAPAVPRLLSFGSVLKRASGGFAPLGRLPLLPDTVAPATDEATAGRPPLVLVTLKVSLPL